MDGESTTPVLRLVPSRPRILVGMAILLALALLVAEIALTGAYPAGTRLLLLGFAAALGLLARGLWLSGRVVVEFSDGILREAGPEGRVLARIGEIRSVDRGVFAFKPSSGFLIHLEARGRPAWVPGVWWRQGRLLGVGGLVPANQTKLVAETISLLIARRARDG